ncbi:prepilin-type N-terminal cleavage/methylation domain-containing protein [Paenibacillus sp. NFR01]|uniref:type IV pilus modification PilV family protein n=1 Tax=Paenibacillus sp. NFR01 TaxID=1566279 RepID=UPI0008B0A1E2|nr:prepilin-type N-terminal cleavage/methylation domain-containing protein [Paenibacillus sp. NFR01]SEU14621.1 prepilin-type N-terminal cleavage/methylation domain-containing protein [Paenibacillus sp. NFR01]
MLWRNQPKRAVAGEQGFTLIEVLAAVVILSIVSLVLSSYFTNAMSYSKSNQNKTIMVNLARNALFYMEKQDYDGLKLYFMGREASGSTPAEAGHASITATACAPLTDTTASCGAYSQVVKDTLTLAKVLNPTVNNISYQIDIEYQSALHQQMKSSGDQVERATADYLLPVRVRVQDPRSGGNVKETVVEGYITDEKIR